jgi:rare lipoprotein A
MLVTKSSSLITHVIALPSIAAFLPETSAYSISPFLWLSLIGVNICEPHPLASQQPQEIGRDMRKSLLCSVAAAGALASVAELAEPSQSEARVRSNGQVGLASFYAARTGSFTAAHRTLPMGSLVRVTNLKTGKTIIVRISDRGPFVAGRVIDLSTQAAQAIGLRSQGLARVEISLAGRRSSRATRKRRGP